jgi:Fe-S-cluster containining protein
MRATNFMMGWAAAAALAAMTGCGGAITYTIKGTPRAPELDGKVICEPKNEHGLTTIKVDLEHLAPPAPMRLAELAMGFMGFSEQLVQLAVDREAKAGRVVSCQKGCGACCRQIVPLSPPEAWLVADVVAGTAPARRAQVLAVFEQARAALDQSGLGDALRRPIESKEQSIGLALRYFELGVPCPFLRDESCSIYPFRPSMCREYLVTSAPQRCATLGRTTVDRIPVGVRLSEALSNLAAKLLGRDPEVVPLTMALDWARDHEEEGRRTWGARFLFESLVAELSPKRG